MKIFQHKSNNKIFAAPPGTPIEEVRPAPATMRWYGKDTMQTTIRTFWQPSPEELAVLRAGGSVEVEIIGGVMPPMKVSVAEA